MPVNEEKTSKALPSTSAVPAAKSWCTGLMSQVLISLKQKQHWSMSKLIGDNHPQTKKKGTENQYCFIDIYLQSTGLQRVEKSSLFKIKSVHFRAIGQKYNSGITH